MADGAEFHFPEVGQPTKLVFGTGNRLNDELALHRFSDSRVGEWAEQRQERYPEYIYPRMMYVVPSDNEVHHVAWVDHRGTRPLIGDSDIQMNFQTHHVVCDCVMCVDPTERVEAVKTCDVVNGVLGVRAEEIGTTYRNPQLLAQHAILDEETMDFYPAQRARELMELSISTMLAVDHTEPREWMANMQSGVLVISAISRALGVSRGSVLPVVDAMQEAGTVEREEDFIRLGAAAFDSISEKNPLIFVRFAKQDEI